MEVKLLESAEELPAVAGLMLQLRNQYATDEIIERMAEQRNSGYQLAYVTSGDDILCVAGFTVGRKLAWGKHIYIDDLVSDESHRSRGAGAFLMRWFRVYAREQGCEQIHLDSGVHKFPAHRFYLRERFNIASHHFSLTDLR